MELMLMLEGAADFCVQTKNIWILIGKVIRIILIVIPIIIVLMGTFDLGKAVMAGEDKEIKEAQKMFIKRLVYGVIIFFIPYLVAGVYSLFDGMSTEGGDTNEGTNLCWKCAIKGGKC